MNMKEPAMCGFFYDYFQTKKSAMIWGVHCAETEKVIKDDI